MYSRRRPALNVRVLPTPFASLSRLPEPRVGGFAPELRAACIIPSSHPDLARRLETPGLLAVTTGQQPGLFTGPLYTIYKALSAAAMAKRLETLWARPVQAIFWVAGDDHDFAEANHVSWPAQDGSVATITLRDRPAEAPLTPMYRETLGPEIGGALDRLEAELPGSDFKPELMSLLRRHYRPDATVATSFARILADVLAPHGVICLDSSHVAVKRQAAPVMIRALDVSADLDRVLAQRSQDLIAAGQDPKVPVGDGATLVMIEAAQGRDRLVRDGNRFITRRSRETFSLDDLKALAQAVPERLSPNVLLRPVVEAAVLPTQAYVAGPGELRYLALTSPIYQALEVPRQLPVPRWSGMLVEPRVDRVLEKFQADVKELVEPGQKLEARVLRDQLPREAVDVLERLERTITEEYARLERIGVDIDPTLRKPVESARQHALSEARALEKRLLHHMKQRQLTEMTQIARARTAVLPEGQPQERVYSIIGFLARYGPSVMDLLAEQIGAWYAGVSETSRATV
jgi:bacillithiol biosynthesis cysteine-adding enzyme BshC